MASVRFLASEPLPDAGHKPKSSSRTSNFMPENRSPGKQRQTACPLLPVDLEYLNQWVEARQPFQQG